MAKLLMKDADTVHAAEPDYLSPALRTMLFNIVNSQVSFLPVDLTIHGQINNSLRDRIIRSTRWKACCQTWARSAARRSATKSHSTPAQVVAPAERVAPPRDAAAPRKSAPRPRSKRIRGSSS